MTDREIINLCWERHEEGVEAAMESHGDFVRRIAFNILRSSEDAEECASDSFLQMWNAIPPVRPESLRAFLGRIARNTALNMLEKKNAQKRGGSTLPLEEFAECVPGGEDPVDAASGRELAGHISDWLRMQPEAERRLFMRRYWYGDSLAELEKTQSVPAKQLASILFRQRKKLKKYLEQKGMLG